MILNFTIFTSGTPINVDNVNYMRSLRGQPPLNPAPDPGLLLPRQPGFEQRALPLSTVPDVPDTPLGRTQAAFDYYGGNNPATLYPRPDQFQPDIPAPPVREVLTGGETFVSDRRGAALGNPLPSAVTSPLPVEPDIVGEPLAPVEPTNAVDYYGRDNPATLYRRTPLQPTVPAAEVGLPVAQTPQQREILERQLNDQPGTRIARFRAANGFTCH